METYLAHSSRDGYPPQTYEAHIRGVYTKASAYAAEAERYAAKAKGILAEIVQESALMHDLGKLDDKNQNMLHSADSGKRHLPINHVDAGSTALKVQESLYAALIVYSHHRGLPDLETEFLREEAIFRDEHAEVRERTDTLLDELLHRHEMIFRAQAVKEKQPYDGDLNVLFRMALSCLADADHGDTAIAYGQAPSDPKVPQLRAEERLAALDKYVSALGGDDERSRLRSEMYQACRNAEISGGFSMCDSPVGSGKTTAVMAHLLQQASRQNARRIFVVLPYTSIIQQSVDVYRKALVLPGENPEEVVAELHSRADFQDFDTRYLTSLWRAPIIVTTAVDSCIKTIKQLMEQENVMQFRTVNREFEVIDADTIPAVVNSSLAEEIAHGRSDWKTLQRQSVSIRRCKIKQWNLKEIASGVYQWTLGYDDFLGYMSGVINTGEAIFC